MNKNAVIILALLVGLIMLIPSCKKIAGEGGGASILGKVYNELYDHNGNLVDTEEAREEDVYIVYGEHEFYDDNRNTEPDGTYQFNYLRKGNYRIFAYEECDSCDSEAAPVEVTVEITDKKEAVTASDIILRQSVAPDDGNSIIYGTVKKQNYNGTFPLGNPYPAQNERVFIIYDTDQYHFEMERTANNGTYFFPDLIKGTYTIYTYSQCMSCSVDSLGIETVTVSVTENAQTKQAPEMTVEWRGF